MKLIKLPRSFYLRPTIMVAKELLGMFLVRRVRNQLLAGRIVEVEAYLGERDPASHAYRGMTRRNEVMFRRGGHLYVYFTYGMHFCSNVVTEAEGIARAVLLRALEPVEGIEVMVRNRRLDKLDVLSRTTNAVGRGINPTFAERTLLNLCSGPAKLCQAFGIGRKQNGTDLCGNQTWLANDPYTSRKVTIAASRRVGVNNGARHKWRFYIKGNPYVSKGKPARI
jgi:DNA-3-methyladenine glycosylase